MGYRTYICQIKKEDYDEEKIKNNYDYLREKTEELHELGKYYNANDFEGFEIVHNLGDDDREYYVITRDSLLAIIKDYHNKTLSYYKSIFTQQKEADHYRDPELPIDCVEKKLREWGDDSFKYGLYPYNLKLNDPCIVNSWSFEYAIFELVRVYKTFNPETHYMVYRGY